MTLPPYRRATILQFKVELAIGLLVSHATVVVGLRRVQGYKTA
jgi:hypothetical protein